MKAQTKAIAASLVVIMLALSAFGGVTYSWFSDTEESEITINTATVKIDAGNWFINGVDSGSKNSVLIEDAAALTSKSLTNNFDNISTISIVYQIIVNLTSGIEDADIIYDYENIEFNGVELTSINGVEVDNNSEINSVKSATYKSMWYSVDAETDFTAAFSFVFTDGYSNSGVEPGVNCASDSLKLDVNVVAYQSDYTGAINPTEIVPVVVNNALKAEIPEDSNGFISVEGTIDDKEVKLTADSAATEILSGSELEIKKVDSGEIKIGGNETLASFDISALKGEQDITTLNGGYVDLTVQIPGTPESNKNIIVYYYKDGKAVEVMPIISMIDDSTEGTYLTFRTTHFSLFALAVPQTSSEVCDSSESFKEKMSVDKKVISITLISDVTYDVGPWDMYPMGGKSTEKIIVDLNNNKLTFNQKDSDWNNIVTANGATLVLKNGEITNSGHNDGPWNRHDLNFACNVALENVNSDKALAFKAGASLDKVSINDKNKSDTYGIWIQPNGQTVTIKNSAIDMIDCTDGRGIKIDNQYNESAEKRVTLNVSNTVFKTEEKSAIIVKTTVGADIHLDNLDISGVVADSINEVWVDSDARDSYNMVNVTGGSKIYEGTPVTTADELIEALESGKDVVFQNDIKIDPATMSNAYGTTGINVKSGQYIFGNGYTLDIKGAGGTWDSGINTTGGLIKDLTVTGSFRGIFINHNSTYSEKIVLENVIIKGVTYTISCDQGTYQGFEAIGCTFNGWTSYAKTLGDAKFVDCNFGEGNGYKFCRPYSSSTFIGCNFISGYKFDGSEANSTFKDCCIDNVLITDDNKSSIVYKSSENVTIDNTN